LTLQEKHWTPRGRAPVADLRSRGLCRVSCGGRYGARVAVVERRQQPSWVPTEMRYGVISRTLIYGFASTEL